MSDPVSGSLPPDPPEGPGAPPPDAPRRRPLGPLAPLLVVVLAVAALASVAYFFTRRGRIPGPKAPSASASRKPAIAIFPFPAASGAGDVAWVGQAAFQFLPLVMEDSVDLRVLTPERLHDLAKGDLPDPLPAQLELARKGGATFLLRGEVSGNPGAANLKASWVAVGSGSEAARWEVSGIGPENLGKKLDQLYTSLRRSLRLGPLDPTDPPLSSLVPVKEGPTRSYLEAAGLLDRGDPDGCLKKLEEALTLPDFHLAHFLQAEAAARAGKRQTAVAAATRLSKISRPLPARVTLLTPVILAIYGSGNPRSAVDPLESFLARFPQEKYPRAWLGAIQVLLLNQPEKARENLGRSLALDPSNQETRRLLAQATLAAGHPAEAIPILQEYLKSRAEDVPGRLLLCDSLRRAGRLEESRREAEEVLSRQPENVRAVGLLGSVLLQQGKTGEAEALYTKLARSSRPAIQAQGEAFLAQWSLLMGKFQEGLRQYRAAADKAGKGGDFQSQGDLLLALADAQSSLGQYPEALATLGEVRGVNSKADADLPMINVIVAQKEYGTARKLMDEQVNRWQGRVPGAVLERLRDSLEATIALDQGKYDDAVKKIQASFVGTDKGPPVSETLGRAYLGAGDAVRAEKIFREITQDPDRFHDPVRYLRCLIRLGEACEKQGKRKEALQSYHEALKWWGSADLQIPVISEAREGLKRLAK